MKVEQRVVGQKLYIDPNSRTIFIDDVTETVIVESFWRRVFASSWVFYLNIILAILNAICVYGATDKTSIILGTLACWVCIKRVIVHVVLKIKRP